ncbi:uncharacterized protein LOC718170 isoform X2 [Macaca mulatta]
MLVSWARDSVQSLQPVPVMPATCPSFSTALCRGSPNLTLYRRKLRPRGWPKTCPWSHTQASCCHLPTGPYKQGGCVWARGWAAQGREALCTKLGGRDLGVWVQEEAACSGLWPGSSIHQALGPTPLIPTDPNTKADTVWVSGSTSTSASCRPAPLAAPPSATSSAATLTLHSTRTSCTHGCLWSMTNVGGDFKIDSGAMEDHCGVCQGNDSTCHTVCRGRMDTAWSSKQGPWTRRTVPPWASPMTARGSAVAALPCQMVGR